MDQLIRDIRFAFRNYRRRPAITLVAVITLAVGVGANVAVFSVVRAVLMSALPYSEPDRLVTLAKDVVGRRPHSNFTLAEYEAIRDASRSYRTIAGCTSDMSGARGSGDAEEVLVNRVTPDFFSVFGVAPAVGRVLGPADFTSGARPAVISSDLWTSQFGRVPDVTGRTIRLNREPWTVVGVMPPSFAPPCAGIVMRSAWVPLVPVAAAQQQGETRPRPVFPYVFARLAPQVNVAVARVELAGVVARRLRQQPPEVVAQLDRLGETEAASVRPGLLMLQGVAAFLLIISCVNLANLLLAHSTVRCGEVGVRLALGAQRRDIVRQLLTEAAVLSTIGGVAGVAIACWSVPVLVHMAPSALPAGATVAVRIPELAVGVGLSWLTAMAFGVVPALMLAGVDVRDSLHGAAHVTSGRTLRILRAGLVAAEVVIAVVVLTGAGLLLRSFMQVVALPMGFDSRGLVVAEVPTPPDLESITDPGMYRRRFEIFERRFEDEVRARLGGRQAAFASSMPFSSWITTTIGWNLIAPGGIKDVRVCVSEIRDVSLQYFEVLRVPLVRGRLFPPAIAGGNARVAIVNEAFARRCGRGRNVLGFEIDNAWARESGSPADPITIVGVVGDTRAHRLSFAPSPAVYLPLDHGTARRLSVAVRGIDVPAVSKAVREAARAIDPDLPLTNIVSVDAEVRRSESTRYFYVSMMSIFGGLAGLLAAVGIFGVVAHVTSLRLREFGIRVALGARPAQISRLVVGQGLRPVVVGLAGGIIAAWWLADLLEANKVFMAQLYHTAPQDLRVLAAATAGLLAIGAVACWLPARRTARVDPVSVLKVE